ncbi:MAG: N-acetyltransferase, partial [Duncaniella sp.]|nr:N-acetyltransferase [Duncaniella sp.]
MCELKIRPATAADAAEVAEIYRYYVEGTTVTFDEVAPGVGETREAMERIVRQAPYLVAETDGK